MDAVANLTPEQQLVLQQIQTLQTMGIMATQFPRPTVKRRKPVKWETWEEKNLIEGVRRFGRGNWAQIRAAFEFQPCRTNVDLHDKWRVLTGERKRSRVNPRSDAILAAENASRLLAENGQLPSSNSNSPAMSSNENIPEQNKDDQQNQTTSANEAQIAENSHLYNFANLLGYQPGQFTEGQFTPEMLMQAMQEHMAQDGASPESAEQQLAQVVAAAQLAVGGHEYSSQPKKRVKKAQKPDEDDIARELLKLSGKDNNTLPDILEQAAQLQAMQEALAAAAALAAEADHPIPQISSPQPQTASDHSEHSQDDGEIRPKKKLQKKSPNKKQQKKNQMQKVAI